VDGGEARGSFVAVSKRASPGCPRVSVVAAAHAARSLFQRPSRGERYAGGCNRLAPLLSPVSVLMAASRDRGPEWMCVRAGNWVVRARVSQLLHVAFCALDFPRSRCAGFVSSLYTASSSSFPSFAGSANWSGRDCFRCRSQVHAGRTDCSTAQHPRTAQAWETGQVRSAKALTKRARSGCGRPRVTSGDGFQKGGD
jgi:hypothetical protein